MGTAEDRYYDAIDDAIAQDQAERDVGQLRAHRGGLEIGDRVTIGDDPAVWTVESFNDEHRQVRLSPWFQEADIIAHVDQLTHVEDWEGLL